MKESRTEKFWEFIIGPRAMSHKSFMNIVRSVSGDLLDGDPPPLASADAVGILRVDEGYC